MDYHIQHPSSLLIDEGIEINKQSCNMSVELYYLMICYGKLLTPSFVLDVTLNASKYIGSFFITVRGYVIFYRTVSKIFI